MCNANGLLLPALLMLAIPPSCFRAEIVVSSGNNAPRQIVKDLFKYRPVLCCGKNSCFPRKRLKYFNESFSTDNITKLAVLLGNKMTIVPQTKLIHKFAKNFCVQRGMILFALGTNNDLKILADHLKSRGLEDEHVFVNSEKRFKTGWANQKATANKKLSGRRPGQCLTVWRRAVYATACDQPAQFACEATDDNQASILGKSYIFPTGNAKAADVSRICEGKGFHPVSLATREKQDAVCKHLESTGLLSVPFMTSLNLSESGGQYAWATGSSSYIKWCSNEPAAGGKRKCGSLVGCCIKSVSCDQAGRIFCEEMSFSMRPMAQALEIDLGDSVYLIPEEKASYEEAKKLCGSRGMKLLALEGTAEADLLADFLANCGHAPTSFGMSKKSNTDGCSALLNAKVQPKTCDAKTNFICEADKNTKGKSVLKQLPIKSAKRISIGKKKYLFPSDKASYDEAVKLCEQRGMQLASFEQPPEQSAVLDYIGTTSLANTPLLIGLKKSTDKFEWGQGVAAKQVPWAKGQPAPAAGCAATEASAFAAVKCEQKMNFICESPEPQGVPKNFKLAPADKAPRLQIGEQKYMIPSDVATFEDAKEICEARNMDVASLESPKERDTVSDFLGALGGLDLSMSSLLTSFLDVSSDLLMSSETDGQPKKASGGCAGLAADFFQLVPCEQPSKFMCEARPPENVPEDFQLLPFDKAPSLDIDGLKYIISSDKASASEAAEMCRQRNMNLASFETAKESDTVSDFVAELGLDASAIFTSLSKSSGTLEWLGGAAADFLNLDSGQKDAGDCGAMGSDGILKFMPCDQPQNFICESPKPAIPKNFKIVTVDKAPRLTIGGRKYILPGETATLAEAKKLCAQRNMDLVSLETFAENELINNYLQGLGLSSKSLMTSLTRDADGSFKWNGISVGNFFSWEKGSPTNENCASLVGGVLRSVSCDAPQTFMCESNTVPKIPEDFAIKSVDDAPVIAIGGQEYLIPSDKGSFEEADKLCGKRDMGVISLEQIAESDAVTDVLDMLGMSSSTIMTSLSKNGDGDFAWASGLMAEFVNWGPDQPNKNAGDCTGILQLVVSVVPCDTVANFICEDKGVDVTKFNTSDNSYLVSSEKVTRAEAESKCADKNMRLVSTETLAEKEALANLMTQNGLPAEPYWISLNKIGASSFSWLGGVVNGMIDVSGISGGDCVTLTGSTLQGASCDSKMPYICEANAPALITTSTSTSTTTTSTTSTTTTSTTSTSTTTTSTTSTTTTSTTSTTTTTTTTTTPAPLNFTFDNKTYFYLNNERSDSILNAKLFCEGKNMSLATFNNESVMTMVKGRISNLTQYLNLTVAVGAEFSFGKFAWPTRGRTIRWAPGEPYTNRACSIYKPQNNYVYSANCSLGPVLALCDNQEMSTPSMEWPEGGKFFHLHMEHVDSFEEAQFICKNLGMTLASLDSDELFNNLPKNVTAKLRAKGEYSIEIWTSLRRSTLMKDTLHWPTGPVKASLVSYYYHTSYECGFITQSSVYMQNCMNQAFVLCDNATELPPAYQKDCFDITLPENQRYKLCYNKTNYIAAEKYCQSIGMELASLDGPSEKKNISDFLKQEGFIVYDQDMFISLTWNGTRWLWGNGVHMPQGWEAQFEYCAGYKKTNRSYLAANSYYCEANETLTKAHILCEHPENEKFQPLGYKFTTYYENYTLVYQLVGSREEAIEVCRSSGWNLTNVYDYSTSYYVGTSFTAKWLTKTQAWTNAFYHPKMLTYVNDGGPVSLSISTFFSERAVNNASTFTMADPQECAIFVGSILTKGACRLNSTLAYPLCDSRVVRKTYEVYDDGAEFIKFGTKTYFVPFGMFNQSAGVEVCERFNRTLLVYEYSEAISVYSYYSSLAYTEKTALQWTEITSNGTGQYLNGSRVTIHYVCSGAYLAANPCAAARIYTIDHPNTAAVDAPSNAYTSYHSCVENANCGLKNVATICFR